MAKGVPAAGENRETEGDDSEGELVEAEWDDRGMCERDLREEAVSMEHLMCHHPKNWFCKACQRSRLRRKANRKRRVPTDVPQ